MYYCDLSFIVFTLSALPMIYKVSNLVSQLTSPAASEYSSRGSMLG